MNPAPAPGCDDRSGHCVTCSDEGTRMRVEDFAGEAGMAVCVDDHGAPQHVDVSLVTPVVVGDVVLVHAGIALVRLDAAAVS